MSRDQVACILYAGAVGGFSGTFIDPPITAIVVTVAIITAVNIFAFLIGDFE